MRVISRKKDEAIVIGTPEQKRSNAWLIAVRCGKEADRMGQRKFSAVLDTHEIPPLMSCGERLVQGLTRKQRIGNSTA